MVVLEDGGKMWCGELKEKRKRNRKDIDVE
jgi:hypothetical protein